MPPIVSIVSKKNSGKTTLLDKLIPELCRRGYRVGTVKHDHHGFDINDVRAIADFIQARFLARKTVA
ncbi:MAG: molybdopterin-guanine dinucleotide biosynthesis protein MobB [Desulfatitalea sp.]